MNCGCDKSAKMGTCCKSPEMAKSTPPSQPTANKPGHGTGRQG